ncbi:glycoside hydrolase family 6 protein [Amycolatopsis eburnea]|uniref:Glucanase n=1 Tax=Amycolatopsis eburnea TaxID=2267691 RepID=A0A3R9DUR3_9PSEU|nr:glycoside hydrolase family 6 protein [Amycolatopsis eburnea]RSD11498.1 endoglucanase [Amycolatopsis eburnea]
MRISTWLVAAALALTGLAPASPALAADGNPLEKTNGFYVDPDSNPAVWVRDHPADSLAGPIKTSIATKPGARWFGNWSGDIRTAVDKYTYAADVADKLPVLVAYNIPGRDCGGESTGGAGSPQAYRDWISAFADGIGGKPAIVVLEPDALAQLDCLSGTARTDRVDLLKFAATQFAQKAPNTWAYMDGGNATWIPAATMASRLKQVGVQSIHGFVLNVSNFYTTAESTTYGKAVGAALGYAAPFVVDSSRNGNGHGTDSEWCNPPKRKLGATSQLGGGPEMQLWIKVPGDSDGSCGYGTGIPAGTFSPVLANHLINGD